MQRSDCPKHSECIKLGPAVLLLSMNELDPSQNAK